MHAHNHSADLDEVASSRLQQADQRYTPLRRKLIRLLASADQPMTLPEILTEMQGAAMSSAYRNLAVLERAGLVVRIVAGDGFAHFELAEEFTQHHHHLVCTSCGEVSDVELSETVERVLHDSTASVAATSGFSMMTHRLDIIGICRECAPDGTESGPQL